jgi:hypothetical protein
LQSDLSTLINTKILNRHAARWCLRKRKISEWSFVKIFSQFRVTFEFCKLHYGKRQSSINKFVPSVREEEKKIILWENPICVSQFIIFSSISLSLSAESELCKYNIRACVHNELLFCTVKLRKYFLRAGKCIMHKIVEWSAEEKINNDRRRVFPSHVRWNKHSFVSKCDEILWRQTLPSTPSITSSPLLRSRFESIDVINDFQNLIFAQ